MAAEASPPRLGMGALPETKRGALRRRPTEGDSEDGGVSENSQARVLVVGHGSVPRICEEVIREGGLQEKPSAWPGRGLRVDGLYRQHLRLGRLLGATRRSQGWGVTGERALRGLRRHPRKRGAAASRVWGEESVGMKGCGRSPPSGLARALCSPPGSGPATTTASTPVTDRQAGPARTGRGPQRGAG